MQSLFADAVCGTPLDLALVPSGSCDPPTAYAIQGDVFRPVLDPYTEPIYMLSTGDTCGVFVPEAPLAAHTVGPPLAAEQFLSVTF